MTATQPTNTKPTDIAMRPFTESLPMALLRARESSMRLFRPMLADHDLTEQQWRVLRALAAASKPIDAGELAEATFILAPSLSRMLPSLEDRSLIERATDDDDNRRTLIALSDIGRALVQTVAPQSEELYNAIEHYFGAERLDHLLVELRALTNLRALPGDSISTDSKSHDRK